jgi:hypothetical protein
MGGILQVGGIEGFLASQDQLYEAADVEGQMWREFTGAWWDAFRDAPRKVSELNDLCEGQELMLRVRGDGSPRSQQTRLGSALSSHRDRMFDGRRIVKLNPTTAHKGPTQYRLEPDGVADLGTLGTFGDLVEKGPQTLMPFDSICSGEIGDLGDLEGVPNACAGEFSACFADAEGERGIYMGEAGEKVPNVPKVPKSSVTACNESDSSLGTFDGEVPNRNPEVPKVPHGGLDLADLPGDAPGPGRNRS